MSRIVSAAPVTAAKELFAAVGPYAAVADLTAADWADLAGDCQSAIRVLEATQTLALARVAATDDIVDDDGTVTEKFIGLGHQRLDAPALVSAQLAQTDAGAGRRVATAVDLVTRMPRLVQAMAAGDLDLYRATRIAEELTECPAEICEEVLDRVGAQNLAGDPVGPLARQVRRALAAVNRDLLKKRRIRALSDTGLTRSVDADGVDTWIARMPLEQSAQLWDAINDRAQTIRAQAAHSARTDEPTASTSGDTTDSGQAAAPRLRRMSIHAARLAALTEILMGNITGTFHLHLGIPISLFSDDPGQPAQDDGPSTDQSSHTPATHHQETDGQDCQETDDGDPATDRMESQETDDGDPASGDGSTNDVEEPGEDEPVGDEPGEGDQSGGESVGDGMSPCPSPTSQASHEPRSGEPTRDSSRPHTAGQSKSARSGGACFGLAFPTAADRDPLTPGDPDDLIPVTGFGTAGTVHLPRAFLEQLLAAGTPDGVRSGPSRLTPARFRVTRDVIGCDDHTGAYLTGTTDLHHWLNLADPTAQPPPRAPRTEAYRPTAALRRLLTARDGRCRFPHCQAAARFADIDHVRAWPAGATELAGLALLCRRHHRIKQRHCWQVRIRPDATLEWVTPTGQTRSTHPIDHLEPTRPPHPRTKHGEGEDQMSRTSRFGDPTLPPTQPAQLLPALPPHPRPSTGCHPNGDFGWLADVYTQDPSHARPRVLHAITITFNEIERSSARRHATEAAQRAAQIADERAAERDARDAEPPPF